MATTKICSVDGCGKPHQAWGMCNPHYLRMKRRGTTDRDPNWIRGLNCERGQKIGQCPAAKAIVGHLEYLRNRSEYIARARAWDANNFARKRELMASEDQREKARLRTKIWNGENPDRRRVADEKFRKENRALVRSYQARRRARVRQAVPPWITDEQIIAIQAIYAASARISEETGTDHEVDHIVPLAGKVVSGLHLPQNLRVLTSEDNNRRRRIPDRAELDHIAALHMVELRGLGLAVAISPE